MQRSLFYLFPILFLGLFLTFLSPRAEAAQFLPLPGSNCGVGYPDNRPGQDPNAVPDLKKSVNGQLVNEQYACCGSSYFNNLDQISAIPPELKSLPAIGGILTSLDRIINPLNLPDSLLFFLPEGTLPSVKTMLQAIFSDNQPCETGEPIGDPTSDTCYCKVGVSPALKAIIGLCGNITSPDERQECQTCMGYDPDTNTFGEGGIWTGIGCVRTTFSSFISEVVFRIGIGFAGLVSLGCIIYSAILLQVSQGNPEKIQEARDMIQSCIIGLLMIIFSTFILRLIGVDILRIPGFS